LLMSRLQEIKKYFVESSQFHSRKLIDVPVDDFKWLLSEVERLQAENEQQQVRIKRQNKLVVNGEQKVERLEKALHEIMDLGETYAATTDEHHSCAEGMYRIAEIALETEGKE
jgi:hypothetical protein